jgi:hypothetical protein
MKSAALILVLVLGLAACGGGGDSKEEKAQKQVCAARDDLGKQVETLKGITLSTGTTEKITNSLKAMGDDLNKIKDAQGDLGDQRKQEVDEANKAFESSVKGIASSLGSSTSLSEAKQQLASALRGLATSYQQTFAKLSCS